MVLKCSEAARMSEAEALRLVWRTSSRLLEDGHLPLDELLELAAAGNELSFRLLEERMARCNSEHE